MQQQKLTLFFPKTNRFYEMENGRAILAGTASECTLPLDEFLESDLQAISRHHFRITDFAYEGFAIVDLYSFHGTEVNGVPLKPGTPYFLRHGDTIILAGNESLCIRVQMQDPLVTESENHLPSLSSSSPRLQYDFVSDTFILDGNIVSPSHFTKLEHLLLRYLYHNANRVCTFDSLAVHVWQGWIQNNTIAKTVSNLRKKLNDLTPEAGDIIKTVHGRGFVCDIDNRLDWPA